MKSFIRFLCVFLATITVSATPARADTGSIIINYAIDGTIVSDPLSVTATFSYPGGSGSGPIQLPLESPDVALGTYSFGYISGAPAGTTFTSITPSSSQTLSATNKTETFTFNFDSGHFVSVSGDKLMLNGAPYFDRGANYIGGRYIPEFVSDGTAEHHNIFQIFHDFSEQGIENEFRILKETLGVNTIRVMTPSRKDFQNFVLFNGWAPWFLPDGSINPIYLNRLNTFLAIARRNDIKVQLAFFWGILGQEWKCRENGLMVPCTQPMFNYDAPDTSFIPADSEDERFHLNYFNSLIPALKNNSAIISYEISNETMVNAGVNYWQVWNNSWYEQRVLSFTRRMIQEIRRLDNNHLITSGEIALPLGGDFPSAWSWPTPEFAQVGDIDNLNGGQPYSLYSIVDYISPHFYHTTAEIPGIVQAVKSRSAKPVVMGELGFNNNNSDLSQMPPADLQEQFFQVVIDAVQQNGLSGMQVWDPLPTFDLKPGTYRIDSYQAPWDPNLTLAKLFLFGPIPRQILFYAINWKLLDYNLLQRPAGVVFAGRNTAPPVAIGTAVLPTSRSVSVGTPATAFLSAVSLTSGASACQIVSSLPSSLGLFSYQETDPSTNAPTGPANTSFNLPPSPAYKTFIVSLTPTAPFGPIDVAFDIVCSGGLHVRPLSGLNTLLLSASATPGPDLIALAATPTNDGILKLENQTGAFAVSTVNVGMAGALFARVTDMSRRLSNLSICKTDPQTGCITGPGNDIAFNPAGGETSTFSIFAVASKSIPFDPAANRIFVEFHNSSGIVYGRTSVAVTSDPSSSSILPVLQSTSSLVPSATCGNGSCNTGESCTTCPADCGTCPSVCGNGSCNGNESCTTCPADCGVCGSVCGDGTCSVAETCSFCPLDCGSCPSACGDGTCNSSETCSTCALDCGTCSSSNPSPVGNHDTSDCTAIKGWACDASDYSKPLAINIYDGPRILGTLVGSTTANIAAEAGVANACGGYPNHRFSFTTPASVKTGTGRAIYVYAVDYPGTLLGTLLPNSPKSLTCAVSINNAQFVSQSVPATMVAGQTYAVILTMKNTGTTKWISTGSNPYRLGSANPTDNVAWGKNRVDVPASVSAGGQAIFKFNVTAPAIPGTYNFQWRMVNEGVEWFGVYSTNVSVNVVAAVNNAVYIGKSVPTTMTKGKSYAVSVTMKNTGNTSWNLIGTDPNAYKLKSQNPAGNTTWGMAKVPLPNIVPVNSKVTIKFTATAPAAAGTYNFQWIMIQGGTGGFGAQTPNVTVKVQ